LAIFIVYQLVETKSNDSVPQCW